MKKLILLLFATSLFTCVTTFSYSQNDLSFVSNNNDGKNFNFPVNELNAKAVRHFKHEFALVENESWFKIADGYTAKFKLDDIQFRVGYDKKGNWLNTVKIYHEKQMPSNLRNLVKSNYYDYAITLVEEIRVKNQVAYIVHIENENEFKKLNLSESEITVMEEYGK